MNNKKMKPIDLTKNLARHSDKRYKVRKNESAIKKIVVHTTDRNWTIDQLVEYDVEGSLTYLEPITQKLITDTNRISKGGLPAITYHDVIMPNGLIYHTLPYREISWHAGGYNNTSIAVALMYRCTDPTTKQPEYGPPEVMIKSLQCHCGDLCLKFGLTPDKVVGHRELKGTGWIPGKFGSKRLRKTCPGPLVNLDELRLNISKYIQVKLQMTGEYTGDIDGQFGDRSIAAFKRYKKNV